MLFVSSRMVSKFTPLWGTGRTHRVFLIKLIKSFNCPVLMGRKFWNQASGQKFFTEQDIKFLGVERKRESSKIRQFWAPAGAGATALLIF